MLFRVVMRHGDEVRRIELDAASEEEARMVGQRQNLEIAAEHRTPVYDVESVECLTPARRRWPFGR